ncbi:MAG: beta-lactamase family protein [Dokdonella sp.]|uniref:serine hydrolase domain-containing protein n=1 Tax=Dokdonella sp. TaxID=2291710 RepID=UPI0025BEF87C|nr:serine hydrolase domain-containing protein [Dokdonella sp.]MBZ0223714.1 beta-lactamase family protein [Dokdonella sp.]MCC7255317.1 beta-lactamase family protein [Dokdonella sp.]
MRAICVLFALIVTASARAAVVYDFTPVTQQINGLVQVTPDMNGASLVVMREGVVLYENQFGSFTPTTRVPIASASKWLSALTIERLVERGEMSWADTVGQYIASAPADKQTITLGQLFSHTSGLTHVGDACLGDHQNFSLASCADEILATPLENPPGTAFAYTGNGMQVGGRMAEIATGKAWAQIFADELTTPLGMADTRFNFGNANPQIAGGVSSTLADYSNIVRMVAQQGQWNGVTFLSAAGIANMQIDQTHGVPMTYAPDPFAFGYGYGEWRNSVDAQGTAIQVSSTGTFGSSPWVNNQTGVAAVFLTYSQDLDKTDIRLLWANVNSVVTDPVFSDGFDPSP